MADKADGSVVLAQLQVAFLWECNNKGLSQCGWSFSCLPNLVADCGHDVNHGYVALIQNLTLSPFCPSNIN